MNMKIKKSKLNNLIYKLGYVPFSSLQKYRNNLKQIQDELKMKTER